MIGGGEFVEALGRVRFEDPEIDSLALEQILSQIPSLDSLSDLPKGSPVLVRLDVDVPVVDGVLMDDSRLHSGVDTLRFCLDRGWHVVVIGHIGRDSRETLQPVAEALADLTRVDVGFVDDWFDPEALRPTVQAESAVKSGKPGEITVLENARKYQIERSLWKVESDSFPAVARAAHSAAIAVRDSLCAVEINEAIAASNVDFSSSALPLVMDRCALGRFVSEELTVHVSDARNAEVVVFSGLKIDKLDDLERVVHRGHLRLVIAAGSIAMALKKASARMSDSEFSIGLAETDEEQKAFIGEARIAQAVALLTECGKREIEVVLPVDFRLDDGALSDTIPSDRMQMDIGPKSSEMFADHVREFARNCSNRGESGVMYLNGVFGKFEDERFAAGTRDFIHVVGEATRQGVRTYVGGGEGRVALERYGAASDVTHAFTAGGTVLKCMGNKHLAFLKAMWLQSTVAKRK